jgi:2-dehydropantoate 2-reductase
MVRGGNMKVLIVGAGAMGCLFGGKLKQSGIDVTLFNRPNDHVRKIREEGLGIIEKDGTFSHVSIPVITDPTSLVDGYQLVIVLLKSFATEDVMSKIQDIIQPETIVLTLQNGIGNIESLQRFVPDSQISAGGTHCGAGIIEPGLIAHRAWGKTFVGSYLLETMDKQLHEFASIFSKSGLPTDVVQDVQSVIWTKLMVNIAYNGLTAVTRLKNGDAIFENEGKDIVENLVNEAMEVAHKQGIQILYDNPVHECIRLGMDEIGLNKSSMLTDVLNKRKTEMDSINNAIVELGKKHDIATPYNDMMTKLMKVIEKSYSKLVTSI